MLFFDTISTEVGRFTGRFPWRLLLLGIALLLLLAVEAKAPSVTLPSFGNATSQVAPITVPQQPVQQAPVVPALVIPTFRIHAEGPWRPIGIARNGDEVMKLPIPWDQLVMLPVTPDNKALWFEIAKLDPPPAHTDPNGGNPVRGWSGYLREGNKLTLYGVSDYLWSEQDPQVLSYWKREATIEGLSP